jgi:hypothetical protein
MRVIRRVELLTHKRLWLLRIFGGIDRIFGGIDRIFGGIDRVFGGIDRVFRWIIRAGYGRARQAGVCASGGSARIVCWTRSACSGRRSARQ